MTLALPKNKKQLFHRHIYAIFFTLLLKILLKLLKSVYPGKKDAQAEFTVSGNLPENAVKGGKSGPAPFCGFSAGAK